MTVEQGFTSGQGLAFRQAFNVVFEALDEAAEFGWGAVVGHGGERRAEDASVRAAVAQGDAVAKRGDALAVRARDLLDESEQAQPAQVVGGAARSVGARLRSEQRSDLLAEVAVGKGRAPVRKGSSTYPRRSRAGSSCLEPRYPSHGDRRVGSGQGRADSDGGSC